MHAAVDQPRASVATGEFTADQVLDQAVDTAMLAGLDYLPV